jgi:hypothetical protein
MRAIRAVAAALVAGGVAFVFSGNASAEEDKDCVVYSEALHDESQSLAVKIVNECKRAYACGVDFTVTCGKDSKIVHAAAVLASKADQSWSASANDCKKDWSISSNWRCNPQ